MTREERLRVLEMIILDIQEEIEKEEGNVWLFESDRLRMAQAIDSAYSVDEEHTRTLLINTISKVPLEKRIVKLMGRDSIHEIIYNSISQSDEVLKATINKGE